MKIEKEHSKSVLMNWTKEQLVEYITCLEYNNNVLHENSNIQCENIKSVLEALEHIIGIYAKYNPHTMKFNVEKQEEQ